MTTAGFWAAALTMVALGWALLCLPMRRRRGATGSAAAPEAGPSADHANTRPPAGDSSRSSADASLPADVNLWADASPSVHARPPADRNRSADLSRSADIRSSIDGRTASNAAILAEQLQALQVDHADRRIDDDTYGSAVLELQRRLLAEADADAGAGLGMRAGAGAGAGAGMGAGAAVTVTVSAGAAGAAGAAAGALAEVAAGVHPSSMAAVAPPSPARGGGWPGRNGASDRTDRGRGRGLPVVLALCLPAIAIGGYALLGNPAALALPPAAVAMTAAADPSREVSTEEVAAMVDALATRLATRPAAGAADLQGWVMLGRSYAALQRFDAAAGAFARALALAPNDAQLLADRADMLAMQQGQRLDGEPDRLIQRALALDPKQPKALALAGSAAFERQQWAEAAGYWQRARALVDDGSDAALAFDRSLAEAAAAADRDGAADRRPGAAVETTSTAMSLGTARSTSQGAGSFANTATTIVPGPGATTAQVGSAGNHAGAGTGTGVNTNTNTNSRTRAVTSANTLPIADVTTSATSSANASAVSGTATLSAALAGKVLPGDTVFVFARAAQGPRMPLAILRRTAADLPLAFRLDDSQAMSPALKLSNFSQVVVGVRVSRSGEAMPQPGDLIGEAPAAPGGAAVQVAIDRVQP